MATIEIDTPGCGTWPLDTEACEDWATLSPAATGQAASAAVANLYWLTGRQFDQCQSIFRPCHRLPSSYSTWSAHVPFSTNNGNVARLPGHDDPTYACGGCLPDRVNRLVLPVHPIVSVDDVTIEGSAEDPSEFRVDNNRFIIWESATKTWPTFQDLTAVDGDLKTWSITVTHGKAPPAVAASIVGSYACELGKHIDGQNCRLPTTVTSASRQGVTFQFVSEEYLRQGMVGLPDVDRFILSTNPNGLSSRPRVFTPDNVFNQVPRRTN